MDKIKEIRKKHFQQRSVVATTFLETRESHLTIADVDALFAALDALKAENEKLRKQFRLDDAAIKSCGEALAATEERLGGILGLFASYGYIEEDVETISRRICEALAAAEEKVEELEQYIAKNYAGKILCGE